MHFVNFGGQVTATGQTLGCESLTGTGWVKQKVVRYADQNLITIGLDGLNGD